MITLTLGYNKEHSEKYVWSKINFHCNNMFFKPDLWRIIGMITVCFNIIDILIFGKQDPKTVTLYDIDASFSANGNTAFKWKLCCHWLKGLHQWHVVSVRQGPVFISSKLPCWQKYCRPYLYELKIIQHLIAVEFVSVKIRSVKINISIKLTNIAAFNGKICWLLKKNE